jgi:hypothetical protein
VVVCRAGIVEEVKCRCGIDDETVRYGQYSGGRYRLSPVIGRVIYLTN